MSQRPVFVPIRRVPYTDVFMTDFVWNSGLSPAQKKKNVSALHDAFLARFPSRKILEISSKSQQELGIRLSAFHLTKYVPSLDRHISLECIFQGSKVFAAGGPFPELYLGTSREAKTDHRLRTSGELRGFRFEGRDYPLWPITGFYDWLYIQALNEHPQLAEQLLSYDAFTDIEFNPNKSKNCQANAAALYVSLARQGLLDRCGDFDAFAQLVSGK